MRKMKNSVKCLVAFFAMATAFCATSVTAKAAVTLQQVAASNTSVKIQWTQAGEKQFYGYQVATDAGFTNIIEDAYNGYYSTERSILGLSAGTTYYIRMGYGPSKDNCKNDMSAPLEVVTAPVAPAAVKFVGADDTTATIAYDACAGATGYDIQYNKAVIGSTADTTYKVPVIDGASSYVYVSPYRTSASGFKAVGGSSYCNNVSKLTTTISKDNFGIVNAWTNTNVFYFAAIGYGSGVDLEAVPVNGKGNAFTITGSLNSSSSLCSDKQVTKGTMYKYRVRAYVTTTDNQKVYGNWSDYRYFINTKDSKYVSSGKKIKLKWGKLKGVSKVKIQIATSENGSYKTCKVLSSKKRTYNITKCGKKPLKRGKKYWVKITYQTKGGESDVYGIASGVTVR